VCVSKLCMDKLRVSKLCESKFCVRKLCVWTSCVCVSKLCVRQAVGGRAEGRRECTTKNKNPTQRKMWGNIKLTSHANRWVCRNSALNKSILKGFLKVGRLGS